MRLVEEVYVKAEKDLICQNCGCDIPEGSNHLLESYVHKGKISTSHYCLKKKCNPPNNVRLRLFWGSIVVGLASWVIYLSFFNWEFLRVSQTERGVAHPLICPDMDRLIQTVVKRIHFTFTT